MTNLKNLEYSDGTEIIDSEGKIDYNSINNIPSTLLDTSTHNHDDLYKSKFAIEDEFSTIMNKVAQITKALTIRPLKTKGFLNGGYKSGSVWAQRVQRFNTVTETGLEIGQIGTVTCEYSPGGSSELHGYYFGIKSNSTARDDYPNHGTDFDKITYMTEVEEYIGALPTHTADTTLYNIYSQTQVYYTNGSNNWSRVQANTNAITTESTTALGYRTTRQGLSSEFFGYTVQTGQADRTSAKYTYLTKTSETGTTQNIRQYPTGLSKDKNKGYWVDYGTANNWRVDMVNNTVANVSCFTVGFGESNSLGSEKYGFMMGGYDGAQHGKVQKLTWTTEAASDVLGGSLSLPQSSAGMAES